MQSEAIDTLRTDLQLLHSSVLDDELSFVTGSSDFWLSPDAEAGSDATLPTVDIQISAEPKILLRARWNETAELDASIVEPDHDLDRADQGRLNDFCASSMANLKENEDPTPVFNLFLYIREFVIDNPMESVQAKRDSLDQPREAEAAPLPAMQLKAILIWSHHLLAVSKRKDIVAWSTELHLCGMSKPGYPGIIIVEGLREDADEFLARIKRLQWQALQVRCEEVENVDLPEDMVLLSERQAAARKKAKLRLESQTKASVVEVETLAEVSERLTNAGLRTMFESAMKLHK